MNEIPLYVYFSFGATVLLAISLFYIASRQSKIVLAVIGTWIIVQSALALSGFYKVIKITPPRFGMLLFPPMIVILALFSTKKGRTFIDGLSIKWLTFIHIVRLPIEIVLYWLYIQKWVPELMTFEGRNFDIISGVTAIPIFYFAFRKKQVDKALLATWNFIALFLLINIIIHGLLSSPTRFQQFAFEQPNIAVLHFPFNLLPSVIVPIVLFSHLASLWKLSKNKLY